ncbi:CDP-archaeol synthase [Oscillatoriales cyanobacterium LEGE 11467]|uniref:CDP-archaeol synthase n=1 Tax=Zarconia navalis LEGE 11467 TaxID=1828826 RepID=A0A928W016_9CYAN|nr:CDP-archaeol synthase [Zarconia navalis]MBE9040800.1 CDP-archaeol synthase [Zarconia navalis LEGE 11467]
MNIDRVLSTFLFDTFNLFWLGLGLFVAAIIEVFLWKTPVFQLANQPIQTEWFGANKKWRGLISLPIAHTISVLLFQFIERLFLSRWDIFIGYSSFNVFEYGLLVGFIFNFAELPNSFVKRRLNIPPGDESSRLFYFIDHMDSTFGVVILWYFYFHFSTHLALTGFVVTPLFFMGATELRKKLGLK